MRAFLAIAKKAFRASGSGGAKASRYAFYAMALSGLVVFSLIAAVWVSFVRNLFAVPEGRKKVVVVNATDSFREFADGKDDPFIDYRFVEHPYVYDVSTFSDLMKETGSHLTIVFDQNGDILTFYPVSDLDYTEERDVFKLTVLEKYADFVKEKEGIPVFSEYAVEDFTEGLEDPVEGASNDPFLEIVSFSLIPLLYFIAALYAAMIKGTNVIAGAKEQNTFAKILMTPVPRRTIILGNVMGVWLSAMIPALVITVPLILVPGYRAGLISVFLIVAILSVFIAAIVILISVMSSNVITAQTAFLPVFFIFVFLCISCMHNPDEYSGVYEYMPLYGQYLGIGMALTGQVNILALLCSSAITLLLAAVCVLVSVKLLGSERFTVSVMSSTDKELIRAKKQAKADARKKVFLKAKTSVFGYKPKSSLNDLSFSLTQLFRPLVLLSVFQLIAMIPPLLMTNGEYLTNVIASLKAVKTVPDVISSGSNIIGVLMSTPAFLLSMALGYILIDAYYCLRVRFIERTSLSSGLGLPKDHIGRRYLTGMGSGLIMMACVFGILVACGQIKVTGFGIAAGNLPLFFSFVVMWIFQGACEEIMFRGYMMPRIAARYGLIPAIAVSSILFCLFHGMNPGFTALALINLILVSVLFALIAYFTDNIWIVCAAHTMWNFTQGNVFGLEVSGNSGNVSLIHTELTGGAKALMTGGTFGPEGGLAVTIVTLAAICLVLIIFRKKIRRKRD